jgi:hypothetical protein
MYTKGANMLSFPDSGHLDMAGDLLGLLSDVKYWWGQLKSYGRGGGEEADLVPRNYEYMSC